MSSKKIKLLIGAAILAALIAFVWFLNTGKNFEDCVLKNLKGPESSSAVVAINNACAKKFPTVEKEDVQSVEVGLVDFSIKLQPETTFYNISLGDSEDTVIYKLGPAKKIEGVDWEYTNPAIGVSFKDKRVIEIFHKCNFFDRFDVKSAVTKPALNGVSCGASESDLLKRYGDEAKIYCYQDKERRLLLVSKLNLFFNLHRGYVDSAGVENRIFNLEHEKPALNECVK